MKIKKEQVDANVLAQFDLANFSENHRMGEGEWAIMLGTGRVCIYTARDEQEEIAAILVLKSPKIEVGLWYFFSIAVSEKYRRSGLASRLFRKAIKEEIPFGIINSHCHIDNVASIEFHKSLGFVPVQYVNDFYEEFEDAILWRRER